mgnify:CR=1 FL=1
MSKIKLNEKIINGIKENCEGDSVIEKFLIDLMYEEVNHTGQWRWKESYKQKVEKSSSEWGKKNEN